jgi:hypothetical protein
MCSVLQILPSFLTGNLQVSLLNTESKYRISALRNVINTYMPRSITLKVHEVPASIISIHRTGHVAILDCYMQLLLVV